MPISSGAPADIALPRALCGVHPRKLSAAVKAEYLRSKAMGNPDMGSKFLQLLKEMKPEIGRVTAIYDAGQGSGKITSVLLARLKQFGTDMRLELTEAQCSNAGEIEAAIASLSQGDGLWVAADPTMSGNRRLIIDLAARYRVPAIYPWARYILEGGLIAYSIDYKELWRSSRLC